MPTLQMTDVTKSYRTDLIETRALNRISLSVDEGEFVAVSGPSGSGKTTFLNVLGLLDTFESGSYHLDGEDVSRLSDRRQARIRNEKIGFVFQSFNLIPDLDVFDNVDVPLRYRGLPARERRERIEECVARAGLTARLRHLPSQLSGGQQQRVAIARALSVRPKLILADEPTGNLDSTTAQDILALLHEVNDAGTTIVMVTHDPACAAHAARRIHMLDGRLIDVREEMPSLASRPLAATPAAS
jgi:putative ABC transport system ATP-binding protein